MTPNVPANVLALLHRIEAEGFSVTTACSVKPRAPQGRRGRHDAETVRLVRRWWGVWTSTPKPGEVARALRLSRGALEQMARGHTYKWVRP